MLTLTISKAQNGLILTVGNDPTSNRFVGTKAYIFKTIDELTLWVSQNFYEEIDRQR